MRPEYRRFFGRLDRGEVAVEGARAGEDPLDALARLADARGLAPLRIALGADDPGGVPGDDLRPDHPAVRARGIGAEEARRRRIGWVPGPGAGRVAVTVFDVGGEPVGRVLRRVDPDRDGPVRPAGPKWLTTAGFPSGRHLYNLDLGWVAARRSRMAILVEGPFDALHLARAGWPNALALLGNRLTGWHVDLLLTVGVESLALLLDNDHGGRMGSHWALDLDGRLDQFRVVDLRPALPRGRDPDELAAAELSAILGPLAPPAGPP